MCLCSKFSRCTRNFNHQDIPHIILLVINSLYLQLNCPLTEVAIQAVSFSIFDHVETHPYDVFKHHHKIFLVVHH